MLETLRFSCAPVCTEWHSHSFKDRTNTALQFIRVFGVTVELEFIPDRKDDIPKARHVPPGTLSAVAVPADDFVSVRFTECQPVSPRRSVVLVTSLQGPGVPQTSAFRGARRPAAAAAHPASAQLNTRLISN